jgi:hypothetical protein
MFNVDLNNWHVDIVSGRFKFLVLLLIWHVDIASEKFKFLVLLLIWHVNIANLGSMHNVLIMQVLISCVFH